MRRARIETLEKRKMFSVTDLILDPFNAEVVSTAAPGDSAAIVDYLDEDDFGTPRGLGKMHLEDISLGVTLNFTAKGDLWQWLSRTATVDAAISDLNGSDLPGAQFTAISELDGNANIVGDFNGDATAAESFSLNFTAIEVIARQPETAGDYRFSTSRDMYDVYQLATDGVIGPQAGDATVVQGVILPYIEQDNLYKAYIITNNNDPDSMVTDITDGSSNTMMFATRAGGEVVSDFLVNEAGGTRGIIAILIGLAADPSGTDGHKGSSAAAPLDTWEHASMDRQGPATNGIIAVLIGLTVDPSDPSGHTAAVAQPLANANEFFSRFSNTTLDDEALVATTYGRGVTSFYDLLISSVRGGAAAQITHDVEFEKWASAPPQAHGYLEIDLEVIMISSLRSERANSAEVVNQVVGTDHAWGSHTRGILHEDNEFYFPRV